MKIGIGITTHNRREVALQTIANIKHFAPKGSKIIIVDDASEIPYPEADFRFEENVGIAVAKNKCLELLDDCTDIFLFDDDCEPIHRDWWTPYIESGIKHLSYTFDRLVLEINCLYKSLEKPCGCMLYIHHDCLDIIGGFDTDFKGYGYEHVNFSDRVFNNGLTTFRYMDVNVWMSLFKLATTHSSFSFQDRINSIAINEKLYKEKFNSKEFKPYK